MNGTTTKTEQVSEKQAKVLAGFGMSHQEIDQLDRKEASEKIKMLVEDAKKQRGTNVEPNEILNQKELGQIEARTVRRLQTAKQIFANEYGATKRKNSDSPVLAEVLRQIGEEELALSKNKLYRIRKDKQQNEE